MRRRAERCRGGHRWPRTERRPCPPPRRRRGSPVAGRAPGRRRGAPGPGAPRRARRARPPPWGPRTCGRSPTRGRPPSSDRPRRAHPTAATASVWSSARGASARTSAATSARGWTVPTSLLTSMTDTSPTSGPSACASASRSMTPHRSTATAVPPRAAQALSTAWCSIAEHTRVPRPESCAPRTARLSDSVPPEVKTTSSGLAPEAPGHLVTGLVDRHPGPARPPRASPRGCRSARSGRGPWPPTPRGAWAWWPRGRGRPASSKATSAPAIPRLRVCPP